MKKIFEFIKLDKKKYLKEKIRKEKLQRIIQEIDRTFKILLFNHCENEHHEIRKYYIHNINIVNVINENNCNILSFHIELFTSSPGIIIGKAGSNINMINKDVVLVTKTIIENDLKENICLELKLKNYDPLKINYNKNEN